MSLYNVQCRQAGCIALVKSKDGLCDKHRAQRFADYNRQRDQHAKQRQRFYTSKAWRSVRDQHLRDNPLCAECLKLDKITPATIVHHIIETKDLPRDRWLDRDNLESVCSFHHASHHSKRMG